MKNIKEEIKKASFSPYFLAILSVILFFIVYIPVDHDAFRGEMWELLNIRNVSNSRVDQLSKVLSFNCFQASRFQPLAFLLPYYSFEIFGVSFLASHLISQALHILCGVGVAYCCYKWTKNQSFSLIVFITSIYSFLTSDVIGWTFFSYIQLSTLFLIISLYCIVTFYENGRHKYLIYGYIFGILSTLIYEAGLSIFIGQIIYTCINVLKRKKIKILEVIGPITILGLYFLVIILWAKQDYAGSNLKFHYVAFIKPLIYFIYYLRYTLGFTVDVDIYNIPSINSLELKISEFDIVLMSGYTILVYLLFKGFINKKYKFDFIFDDKVTFISICIFLYVLIISYGKVAHGSTFLGLSLFETQFRYYYAFSVIFPLLLILIIRDINKLYNIKIISKLFLVLFLIGNVRNITYFNNAVSAANKDGTLYANRIVSDLSASLDAVPMKDIFVSEFHKAWYLGVIPVDNNNEPFIFNANTCKKYINYDHIKGSQPFFINVVEPPLATIGKSRLAEFIGVEAKVRSISANSLILGSGPENLIKNNEGIWHVMHIPQPPLTSTVIIDLGDRINIRRIKFLPRKDHGQEFWRTSKLYGSQDGFTWIEIAQFSATRPPDIYDWLTVNFINNVSYRYYKFEITSGFFQGRFLSMEGIRLYAEK